MRVSCHPDHEPAAREAGHVVDHVAPEAHFLQDFESTAHMEELAQSPVPVIVHAARLETVTEGGRVHFRSWVKGARGWADWWSRRRRVKAKRNIRPYNKVSPATEATVIGMLKGRLAKRKIGRLLGIDRKVVARIEKEMFAREEQERLRKSDQF